MVLTQAQQHDAYREARDILAADAGVLERCELSALIQEAIKSVRDRSQLGVIIRDSDRPSVNGGKP